MIVTLEELPNIRIDYSNKIIVYIGGTFDLLHIGHKRAFEAARKHGDLLVVSVDSDEATHHYKGKNRPIICEEQRSEMVDSLKMVDFTIINPLGDTIENPFNELNVIKLLQPDIFVTSHLTNCSPTLEKLETKKPRIINLSNNLAEIHTTDIIHKIYHKIE